jgi:hypothetical protein
MVPLTRDAMKCDVFSFWAIEIRVSARNKSQITDFKYCLNEIYERPRSYVVEEDDL